MSRRLILLVTTLFCFAAAAAGVPAAEPHLTETTGTVTGFDPDSDQLSVNSRLGPKLFLVTSGTAILLNNHAAGTNDIQAGDQVAVTYRFDTSVATIVHLFRETRIQGRVVSVGATAIGFRFRRATLQLRTDAGSRIEVADIPMSGGQALIGRRATAIFEPGTLLLLSLSANAPVASGRLSAVDAAARTVTVAGRRSVQFTLDAAAGVRRNGQAAAIADLRVGDRVKVAFAREGPTNRALAVQATGS
jgi:hypothetical protein